MNNDPLLVWRVTEGPYSSEDAPPECFPSGQFGYFVEVMVSYKSAPDFYNTIPMYFEDFNSCYEFKKHIVYSTEPVELIL